MGCGGRGCVCGLNWMWVYWARLAQLVGMRRSQECQSMGFMRRQCLPGVLRSPLLHRTSYDSVPADDRVCVSMGRSQREVPYIPFTTLLCMLPRHRFFRCRTRTGCVCVVCPRMYCFKDRPRNVFDPAIQLYCSTACLRSPCDSRTPSMRTVHETPVRCVARTLCDEEQGQGPCTQFCERCEEYC